ncbi:MAG: hypothetical protein V2I31_14015 [Mariniphaga sp.]|nr:hypothetical protein [Mariniphaga sp.]
MVLFTAITMVVEIIFGLITNSMAMMADGITLVHTRWLPGYTGWHMFL